MTTGRPPDAAAALTFHSDAASPFVEYALGLVAAWCGVALVPTPRAAGRGTPVDVYHGSDAARPCRLRIPAVDGYTVRTVPRLPSDGDAAAASTPGAPFPFDLFAALRLWLADEGNADRPHDAFDEWEHLLGARSAQEECGVREVPVVNAYLLHFREWLVRRLGARPARRLPPGKRCTVVVTHDVDDPISPTNPLLMLAVAGASARRGELAVAVRQARDAASRARTWVWSKRHRLPAEPRWAFRHIREAEERRGIRSTFFFAARSQFEPGAAHEDVQYDVRALPFRRVLHELGRDGWEIGLHISYNARECFERIREERERLEAAAGRPVLGSRHHYWHMRRPFWPTLEDHERAGLRYDTSVAFNETPGYRLGIAAPFHPWNPLTGRAIDVVQIPTVLMDGAYLWDPARTVDAALRHFEGLLATLKRYEGTAAIDWHDCYALPRPGSFARWAPTYLGILDILVGDPEVDVRRGADIVSTVSGRLEEAR